jgi:hypothetical protein
MKERLSSLYLVMDQISKYSHVFSLSHHFKESTIVAPFMEIIQIGSQEIFGLNYFLVWVLNWITNHLITLIPMGKLVL